MAGSIGDRQAEIEELAGLVTLDGRFAGLDHHEIRRRRLLPDLAGDRIGDDGVIAGTRRNGVETELLQFRMRIFGGDDQVLRVGSIHRKVDALCRDAAAAANKSRE